MREKKSLSFKQAVVKAALNRSKDTNLEQFAQEQGVGYSTLQAWMKRARDGQLGHVPSTPTGREKRPVEWTTPERWQAVLDGAGKDEAATAAYCRERGLFQHHVDQWKHELMTQSKKDDSTLRTEVRALKDENKQLKRELARKEKALAEAAALITRRKKLATLWAEDEDV